ncbi:flagellar assembly peptidoglycan hydrolase FlgJ [Chitinimonas sp.]|uniref:flagellar assembly peptidoglycan hydrolase FlgJ n=1 Tax=Chitinimonas sp. TaxID=1934313 RepID=UPI0035AE2931
MQTSSADSALNARLAIDAQAVGDLRAKAAKDPQGAAREVAQQFEKMFLDMVMKAMREATPKFDELQSNSLETFQSMYDQQLSQTLSGGKGLGMADMVARQIARLSDPQALPMQPRKLQFQDLAAAANAAGKLPATAVSVSEQAAEFVSTIGQAATTAAASLGLSPHLMLAHAALETGWGRKPITDTKGRNSHNLFGIKAGSDWTGKTADIVTTEYVDGIAQKRVERFRAYDSYADAFADYAQLLSKRYGAATQAGSDARMFAERLQQGGYATDPHYAKKLTQLAQSPALRAYRAA